jgi:hypothetical protein
LLEDLLLCNPDVDPRSAAAERGAALAVIVTDLHVVESESVGMLVRRPV